MFPISNPTLADYLFFNLSYASFNTFESIREADNAIRDSGHIKFLGRTLDVEFAQGDRKSILFQSKQMLRDNWQLFPKAPHEMKGRGNGRDSKDQPSHGTDSRRWSRRTERLAGEYSLHNLIMI